MKKPFQIFYLVLMYACLRVPPSLQAQSPIGTDFRLYSGALASFEPRVVFYPDGRFLATFGTADDSGTSVWAKRFSASGKSLGQDILVRKGQGFDNHSVVVGNTKPAVNLDGTFWVQWSEDRPDLCIVGGSDLGGGHFARLFSAGGHPEGEPLRLGEDCYLFPMFVLAPEEGRLVVLGRRNESDFQPWVSEFSSSDGTLIQDFAADQPKAFVEPLALFRESAGTLFVAWSSFTGDPSTSGVHGQRFTPDGTPLSPQILFNRPTQAEWSRPSMAQDGAGNFIAVWQAKDRDSPLEDIYAQRVSASGEKIGRIFVVNSIRTSAQRYPSVASDRFGNFVVVWQSFDPALGQFQGWHVRGQLFRKDGRRVGREFVIPNPGGDNDDWQPKVVFGPNGTFLLHYVATAPVLIRRYAASPADEPCIWRGQAVTCDTGRTGGEAEVPLTLRIERGDAPLLGDVDGDGRADPCVRRGRDFLCDTDHEGGKLEWRIRFGSGGSKEIPLFGDVNGDGREDACLRSGRQLQCDTRHNGGKAEWTLTFGEPEDLPLLGDVDGDGRDDLCVARSGRFLCDTAHNGGAAEWTVTFGQPGDLPVLGDFDGNGKDDACVFRAGEFLCDTAHDGGAAEGRLLFGQAGDRPLLGNLDGL